MTWSEGLVVVALNVAAMALSVWRLRQIGKGRADPVIAPDWTTLECPAPPPSAIRWGITERTEVEDDHVGRPFPGSAAPRRMGDLSRGPGTHPPRPR